MTTTYYSRFSETMTKRDMVWAALMTYQRRHWTIKIMKEEVLADIDIHKNTIRSVFKAAEKAGHLEHKTNSHHWYLK